MAHGFDHFNGNQSVKRAGDLSVILPKQIDSAFKTSRMNQSFGVVELCIADRGGGDFNIMVLGQVHRKSAPAGANFNHLVSILDVSDLRHSLIFGLLGCLERDI